MMQMFKNRWNRFCDTTTIHGIRHINLHDETTKSRFSVCFTFKKLAWLLLVLIMASVFSIVVQRNYKRFREGTTLSRSYKIYLNSTKFPVILLCPQVPIPTVDVFAGDFEWMGHFIMKLSMLSEIKNKTRKGYHHELQLRKAETFNLIKCTVEYGWYSIDIIQNSTFVSCLCIRQPGLEACEKYKKDLVDGGRLNEMLSSSMNELEALSFEKYNLSIIDMLVKDFLLDVLEDVIYVKFKDNVIYSTNIFRKMHTRLGNCFKFNLDFTDDLGGIEKTIYNGGQKNGLSVAVLLHENFSYAETGFAFTDGMKILVIQQDDEGMEELVEAFSNDWEIVPFVSQVNVALNQKTTSMLPTSRGMKDYESCVHEKSKTKTFWENIDPTSILLEDSNPPKLKNFDIYSAKKCNFECKIDHIIAEFNCVPLYIKNYQVYKNVTRCSPILEALIENYIQTLGALDRFCPHCKPLCHTSEFVTEISHFKYTSHETRAKSCALFMSGRPEWSNDMCNRITFFNFYFKDLSRDIQAEEFDFKFTDFLTSLGGYFGLFLGASIISVFELLCFFMTIFIPTRKVNSVEIK